MTIKRVNNEICEKYEEFNMTNFKECKETNLRSQILRTLRRLMREFKGA